jgi:hypothetical protein
MRVNKVRWQSQRPKETKQPAGCDSISWSCCFLFVRPFNHPAKRNEIQETNQQWHCYAPYRSNDNDRDGTLQAAVGIDTWNMDRTSINKKWAAKCWYSHGKNQHPGASRFCVFFSFQPQQRMRRRRDLAFRAL